MKTLLNGVKLFHERYYEQQRELFARLSKGQQPIALFITCSDSRIDPNLLTQTRPGDLFVLRNAGNIVPPYGAGGGESATIEYAVAALNITDIVVCGHSNCGAMKAVLRRESVTGLPAVAEWLRHAASINESAEGERPGLDETEQLDRLIEKNVLAQLENLRTHPAVASSLDEGRLRLHGWVYRIGQGDVAVHSYSLGQFISALGQQIGSDGPELKRQPASAN